MRALRLALAGTVMLVIGVQPVAAQGNEEDAFEGARAVSGTVDIGPTTAEGDFFWDEDRQVHERRGVVGVDRIEMDDPRLSGTVWTTWNHDSIGGRLRQGDGEVIAGTYELVNEEGSWVGTMRGYVTLDGRRTHHWHLELTGTGDHAGHSAVLYIHGPAGGPWDAEGLVFPGALPEYPDPVIPE